MAAYFTIASPAQGLYKEKMSKFISFAIPVRSAAEAKAEIERIANDYHDARHVCWAYMTGSARTEYLSSDNGEPSGTAGKPILGQINSFNLTNILIVVVRYFGGIKLGTSGLIVAYRTAAREAIEAAEIVEDKDYCTLSFHFPYIALNDVMKLTRLPGVTVTARNFDNECSMTLTLPDDEREAYTSRLLKIEGLTIV